MATLSIKHFDVLDFVKQSKQLGATQEMAEFQARQLELLADTIQEQQQEIESLKKAEPTTKKDLGIVKLELLREIEVVRREIEVVRREIEVVRKEVALMRHDSLKFTIWTGVFVTFAIASLLAKGFHWF